MTGAVQRDGLADILRRQLGLGAILVESRVELSAEVLNLDLQQKSLRSRECRCWQPINFLVQRSTELLSLRSV